MKRIHIICMLAVMMPSLALAEGEPRRPPGGHGKPPQEAIDACKGK
ncbi:MAG: hypothetical protein PHH28_12800 [Desulfuromonadaceae bacterium]|nr:hypothetical protein [Desulfuromonadaceae bacterium]